MEHDILLYNAYAEFLALRSIEYQLMSSLEQHLEQMSLSNVKLLVKHQKTMNNAMVKTIAKVSKDLPGVIKKLKDMHPETMTPVNLVSFDEDQASKTIVDQYMHSEAPTQPTPSETMTSLDLASVDVNQMHPEAPTQPTPSETMMSPDLPEASTQSTPTETMTSPWLEPRDEDLALQAMED